MWPINALAARLGRVRPGVWIRGAGYRQLLYIAGARRATIYFEHLVGPGPGVMVDRNSIVSWYESGRETPVSDSDRATVIEDVRAYFKSSGVVIVALSPPLRG